MTVSFSVETLCIRKVMAGCFMPSFNILSIDGGGIRGIIPAMILADIERRTGHRIAEMFDMIAGTSTGGILALGLTVPEEPKGKDRNTRPANWSPSMRRTGRRSSTRSGEMSSRSTD